LIQKLLRGYIQNNRIIGAVATQKISNGLKPFADMEKQLRQQAALFLMFSLRVHKRSKVEKERRRIEEEEAKKNAKYKPGAKKPSIKKSAVVTPSAKASTMTATKA
jgi:hypothetical protein